MLRPQQLGDLVKQIDYNAIDLLVLFCLRKHSIRLILLLLRCNLFFDRKLYEQLIQCRRHLKNRRVLFMKHLMKWGKPADKRLLCFI